MIIMNPITHILTPKNNVIQFKVFVSLLSSPNASKRIDEEANAIGKIERQGWIS